MTPICCCANISNLSAHCA